MAMTADRDMNAEISMGADLRREHRARNRMHSIVLIGGIGLLAAVCAYLLWGWPGIVIASVAIGGLAAFGPRVPGEMVMRLYRAKPIDPRHGAQLNTILAEIAARAELAQPPKLYVIPSLTLNAFATGQPERAVIAVTEGLLRKLDLHEITAVLAHEVSHVRNNDLWTMGLADMMSRFTQAMSWTAVFLFLFHLSSIFTGEARVPWSGILLLYMAPTIGSLLQLGLSRAREYDADLESVQLTGDPRSLASALLKLERYQGQMWEDLMPTGRRIPQPSLLRSHPATEDRVARLREIGTVAGVPPIIIRQEPMVTLAGLGPIAMRARHRPWGVWY